MSSLGNKEVFAKNLIYFMRLRGKDRVDICHDLGFKYTTFVDWENAKTYPRIDKIEMLANYFGVEKSDLIEDREKPAHENDELSSLVDAFKSLSESKREQLLDYMRYLAALEKEHE